MKSQKILIAGYFGFHNLGDEAILKSMLASLNALRTDLDICVISGDPQHTKTEYPVNAIHWKDIQATFHAAAESDLLILGGGGIFNDYWGSDIGTLLTRNHAGIPFYAGIPILAHLLHKPVMIYSVGLGPLFTEEGKKLTRIAFDLSDQATIRDSESKMIAKSIGIHPNKRILSADPVFSSLLYPSQPDFKLDVSQKYNGYIAVSLRNWNTNQISENWQRNFALGLDRLLQETGCRAICIPFHNLPEYPLTNDVTAAEDVISKMRHPEAVLFMNPDPSLEEVNQVISGCDMLIGMRLHSLILAARAHTPLVGISYDPKVTSLLKHLKLSDNLIELNSLTEENLFEISITTWKHRHDPNHQLKSILTTMASKSEQSARMAIQLLLSGRTDQSYSAETRSFLDDFSIHQASQIDLLRTQNQNLSVELVEKDKQVLDLRFIHEKADQTISNLNQALEEQALTVAKLQQELSEYQAQLSDLKEAYAKSAQELFSANSHLEVSETKNMELSQKLVAVQHRILNQAGQISRNVQEIHTLMESKQSAESIINEQKMESILQRKQIQQLQDEELELNLKYDQITQEIGQKEVELNRVKAQFNEIVGSRGWKWLQTLWGIRLFLIPHHSIQEKALQSLGLLLNRNDQRPGLDSFKRWIKRKFTKIFTPFKPFREGYEEIDRTQVTCFTHQPEIYVHYDRIEPLNNEIEDTLKITLISAIKNEADNIDKWMEGISNQTRLPDEIIIIDTGSTDNSVELLESYKSHFQIPITILKSPGANIAAARNRGISIAQYPLIAVADFGAHPKTDWLNNLTRPFLIQPEISVSAGIYEAVDKSGKKSFSSPLYIWNTPQKIWPQSYLPPGGSMAFTKDAWVRVGGYPEWLTLTGEDTYFDLELKRQGGNWAFVPDAVVQWMAPDTLPKYLRKMFRWAVGDGEAGIHPGYYWKNIQRLSAWIAGILAQCLGIGLVLLLKIQQPWLWIGLILLPGILITMQISWRYQLPIYLFPLRISGEAAQILGYLKGFRNRPVVFKRKTDQLKGIAFILSGVPVDDTGGGSRFTQFALEFLSRGYQVVFLNHFPKQETGNLNLNISHSNLITSSIANFELSKFFSETPSVQANKNLLAIVEFPSPPYLPVIQGLNKMGATVIYDSLDAWDTSLGGDWYDRTVEDQIIQSSQILMATVPKLQQRLEKISQRDVLLVPNAVNTHLFNPGKHYPPPIDLPAGNRIITYIGALWGDWFDWNLLCQIAREIPNSAVMVIGDYHGQCPDPPHNLHFLGLKPQNQLPAYLHHTDVAIIPWIVNSITQATSPLKLYEYLAMGCPVVAPDLTPLHGMPGVTLAKDSFDFVRQVEMMPAKNALSESQAQFIRENSWQARVDRVLAKVAQKQSPFLVGQDQPDPGFAPPLDSPNQLQTTLTEWL